MQATVLVLFRKEARRFLTTDKTLLMMNMTNLRTVVFINFLDVFQMQILPTQWLDIPKELNHLSKTVLLNNFNQLDSTNDPCSCAKARQSKSARNQKPKVYNCIGCATPEQIVNYTNISPEKSKGTDLLLATDWLILDIVKNTYFLSVLTISKNTKDLFLHFILFPGKI